MSQIKIVEKITHLQTQLERLKNSEFGIRTTMILSAFYSNRIKKYNSTL